MGSSNSRSRNKHRLDGISELFEFFGNFFDGEGLLDEPLVNVVILLEHSGTASHFSEKPSFCHCGETSNVLTNNPSGPDFANSAQHFRPEVTLVFSPPPLTCIGKRLAGKASGEDVDAPAPLFEIGFRDVFITD